jgi:hypothetical protein
MRVVVSERMPREERGGEGEGGRGTDFDRESGVVGATEKAESRL